MPAHSGASCCWFAIFGWNVANIYSVLFQPISSKSPDTVHDLEFWKTLGSCECLESHMKMVVFHGPLLQNHGIGFANYISREGKVLEAPGAQVSLEWWDNGWLELRFPWWEWFGSRWIKCFTSWHCHQPLELPKCHRFGTGRPLLCACLRNEVAAGFVFIALAWVLMHYYHALVVLYCYSTSTSFD
jgi:hypothetical protein